MTAIYYHLGFLTFDMNEVGIGYGSDNSYAYKIIYNFDMGNQDSVSNTQQQNPYVVLWPYSNYKNAQTSFDNSESPNLLQECLITVLQAIRSAYHSILQKAERFLCKALDYMIQKTEI